jgi:hypothetical protein
VIFGVKVEINMAELTFKQRRFVLEYMKDSCATKAAKRAGYSERRASEIGYQLLQKTTVINAIESHKEEMELQLRNIFLKDALKAREVLYEVMISPNATDRDRINAAKDFLDRAGFKAIEKRELSGAGSGGPIEIRFIDPS